MTYWKFICLIFLTTICRVGFCADADNIDTLQISEFRQGLVEFDSNRQPRIYYQGNEFPYDENGMCVASGKKMPCQWYGFEFDFKAPEEVTALDCVTTADHPQTQVHPEAIVEENTQTMHWGFVLTGRSGHYIRPQYTVNIKDSSLRMAVSCKYKGQEVKSWTMTLNPPPLVKAGQ